MISFVAGQASKNEEFRVIFHFGSAVQNLLDVICARKKCCIFFLLHFIPVDFTSLILVPYNRLDIYYYCSHGGDFGHLKENICTIQVKTNIYIYIQCTGLTLFFIFDIFSLSKREKKEAKKKESELKTEKYVSEQSVRISSDKRK